MATRPQSHDVSSQSRTEVHAQVGIEFPKSGFGVGIIDQHIGEAGEPLSAG
jgi:hypothetical protein